MKTWQIRGRDYSVGHNATVFGIGLGSYGPSQSCFIVPIRGQDREVNERAWGIQPSLSGKPMIVSNADESEGVIMHLSSFNRMGKAVGNIYAVDNGDLKNIVSVGYGVGGLPEGGVTWEEALLLVRGGATFFLNQVGPPDAIVIVSGEEVMYREIASQEIDRWVEGDLVRLDDSRVARWKAG